jgi:leader peptidase (prepilin peptidase) / N-methyltransferase
MTAAHHFIVASVSWLVGICVGSFLNVCIHRLPLGLSVWRPRSRCPRCASPIRVHDNVPLLSWCVLRGKCRDCQAAISPRYPLVELWVGVLFAGSYLALAAIPAGDIWDNVGPLGVLLLTVIAWLLISVIVVTVLVIHDGRAMSARVDRGLGIGGQDQPQARSDLVAVPEAVLIELGDFAGSPRVAEPISCDASERLVTADNVGRLVSGFSQPPGLRT